MHLKWASLCTKTNGRERKITSHSRRLSSWSEGDRLLPLSVVHMILSCELQHAYKELRGTDLVPSICVEQKTRENEVVKISTFLGLVCRDDIAGLLIYWLKLH